MALVTGAVVQAGTVLFDKKRRFEKPADLVSDANSKNAQLIVFPEAFFGGYPIGPGFGARLGCNPMGDAMNFAVIMTMLLMFPVRIGKRSAKLQLRPITIWSSV